MILSFYQVAEALKVVSEASSTAKDLTVGGLLLALIIISVLIIKQSFATIKSLNGKIIEEKDAIIKEKNAEIERQNVQINKKNENLQSNMKETLAMANGFEMLVKNELFVKVLQNNHDSNVAINALIGSIDTMKTAIIEKLNDLRNG